VEDRVRQPTLNCKGSWALRTACKACDKCLKSASDYISFLEADFRMYREAWLRELGGRTFPKAHLLDALVLTTRDLKRKADRFDREFGQSLPPVEYALLASPWFEGESK
jgi:hypothetical protein